MDLYGQKPRSIRIPVKVNIRGLFMKRIVLVLPWQMGPDVDSKLAVGE